MCGIAGILDPGAPPLVEQRALEAMQAALLHRGPDGRGMWRSPSGRAGMVHTRLAVLDVTAAGHQPMSTPDGRLTITYNGEIYNFRELRRELEQRGVTFRSGSDTEVILHAYDAYGPASVTKLRGMFAFALWDDRAQTCLLARDAFGIKPFYYHHAPGGALVFASEVKALVASRLTPGGLSAAGLYGYFRTGSVPEPHTILDGVRALEAGHYALWRDGDLETRQYWSIRFPEGDAADAVERTRDALLDSVRHHLVSDVPVGVFLSGGVDSTALVALARQADQRPIATFTMSLPDSARDEGPVAARTAAHFSTTHTDFPVTASAAKRLLPAFWAAADQPSIDGLNTFVLSRCAREQGISVILSGLGADEIFGGYLSFTQVPRMAAWHRPWPGPVRRAAGWTVERATRSPRWRRIGDFLQQPGGMSQAYRTFRGIYTRQESRTLAAAYGAAECDEPVGEVPLERAAGDAVSRLELTQYVRNQLLRDSDALSMACGIELRTPFLDRPLFDTLAAIPAPVRLRPGKHLLRAAVPELPAWTGTGKLVFQFPFADWLQGEWRDVFAAADAASPVTTGTWYRKWSIFMLERWIERLKTHE